MRTHKLLRASLALLFAMSLQPTALPALLGAKPAAAAPPPATGDRPAAVAGGSTVWYFAEGYTGPGFDEYLTILNPNATPASVRDHLLPRRPAAAESHDPARRRQPPHDRRRPRPDRRASAAARRSAPRSRRTNGVGVVVERPMYFTYTAASITGGHNVDGRDARRRRPGTSPRATPATGFDEYLTILNPNPRRRPPVTITYFLAQPARRSTQTLTVPGQPRARRSPCTTPHSGRRARPGRSSAKVDERRRRRRSSSSGRCTSPTAAAVTGGHNVDGREPRRAPTWYFAEGYTGDRLRRVPDHPQPERRRRRRSRSPTTSPTGRAA